MYVCPAGEVWPGWQLTSPSQDSLGDSAAVATMLSQQGHFFPMHHCVIQTNSRLSLLGLLGIRAERIHLQGSEPPDIVIPIVLALKKGGLPVDSLGNAVRPSLL